MSNNTKFKKGHTPYIKGKHHTEETKIKMSKSRKGQHNSSETEFKKGMTSWNKGKTFSKDTCRKISENHADVSGEKNPNFKHGLCGTKEYMKEQNRKRYALRKGAEGSHTIEDLKYIYDHQQGKCSCCRKFIPFEKMTVDHIIPLTWGGSNYASNIQLLCGGCNCSKGAWHDTDYRDYIPLFLE